MKTAHHRIAAVFVLIALAGYACVAAGYREGSLSPAAWSPEVRAHYDALQQRFGESKGLPEASRGMVSGTSSALAVHAGLEALRQGGSAVDAAITTALAQIALVGGSYVSYAGFTTMILYDASTGQIHSLNGGFNTVRDETDPLTIPAGPEPSGRTALVPGFFAGLWAAHDRFGRLPWAALFEPSIYFAEEGVPVTSLFARLIQGRKDVLTRLPEPKRIFTKPDGELYDEGEVLRQPELAETLRRIATEGVDYVYRGEWARNFVDIVRREGGKVTLEDLAAYEPIWGEPAHTSFRGYAVYTLGAPNFGGLNLIEALNLAELAEVSRFGHYTENADALDGLLRIAHVAAIMGTYGGPGAPASSETRLAGIGTDREARLTKSNAERLWAAVQSLDWLRPAPVGAAGTHSDAVVAVDRHGNIAALLHTINTSSWGNTGIFVDGISVPDAAHFQQQLIARVGPGTRLPDPTNPLLVMKDGMPVLVSNSIGSGLHAATLLKLINVLEYGMDLQAANDAPEFALRNTFHAGTFPPALLDEMRARGHETRVVEPPASMPYGYWVAIGRDPTAKRLTGTAPRQFNGLAEGH